MERFLKRWTDEKGRGNEYTHSIVLKDTFPRKKKIEVDMAIVCGKCKQEMKEVELQEYEFEDGIVLENVRAMRCPKGHVTFTEEQALLMETRTEDIRNMHSDSYARSVKAQGLL